MAPRGRGQIESMSLMSGPEGTPGGLSRSALPVRTIVLSAFALAAAVCLSLVWPRAAADRSGLVWILAVIPLFLFLYHRGWKGMAVAAAGVMVVFVAAEVAAVQYFGQAPTWWMYGTVVGALAIVTVGAGVAMAYRERGWREALDIAYRDPETGLPSRRFLDEYLRVQTAAAERGRALAVVLFSLDDFESLKDRWGIGAGERYLRQAGAILRQNLREQDVAGRFGGAEFLTVLADESSAGASVFAERVRSHIAESLATGHPAVTASAGVSAYDEDVTDESDLIARVEDAVLRAKKMGGDKVILFEGDHYREGPIRPPGSTDGAEGSRRAEGTSAAVEERRSTRRVTDRASSPETREGTPTEDPGGQAPTV